MEISRHKLVLCVGVGIGLSVVIVKIYGKFVSCRREPKKWKRIGTLEEITYFPLRSCTGIELDEGFCGEFGIKEGYFHDRIFHLVDIKSGEVGFAGKRPKLYEIKTERIDDNILKVTANGMEDLLIDVQEIEEGKEYYQRFHGYSMELIDCGEKYNAWFSKFLLGKDSGLKLAMSRTPVPKKKWFGRTEKVNYYMATTLVSLEDLNSRLSNPVINRNFRGNFLIKTDDEEPYCEDNWRWMKIGNDTVFKWNAPCYRCILPNVDPVTAKRSNNCEPLKTLKTYRTRKGEKEPIFGTYFDIFKSGFVKKGDDVYISY